MSQVTKSQVPAKATELAEALDKLSAVIEVLECRLLSVMHQPEPYPGADVDKDSALCLMAENFDQCRKSVSSIDIRVQSLISRLEI